MSSIRVRNSSGNLFFDFRFRGKRCREQTMLPDTKANRTKMQKILNRIEAEITLGSFDYQQYFPGSKMLSKFTSINGAVPGSETPLFADFANQWADEMSIQWSATYLAAIKGTFKNYLIPEFGKRSVGHITKSEILSFRSKLAKVPGRLNETLTADRINHIMTPLRMILREAADRFEFNSPYRGIKSLKVPRTDVNPFSLDEVMSIINTVREDFKPYYTVRFFTGLRSCEIHGLKWKHIDFNRRQILVREAYVKGKTVPTKTQGSQREVDLSEPVYQALLLQQGLSGSISEYVFCNKVGKVSSNNNVIKRVWHPLLRHLGLKKRRHYESRHTAATLWLAAGENPQWIARQLGHTTTEMLFRVYSRYVPNMTRQDGSAMDRLLASNGVGEKQDA